MQRGQYLLAQHSDGIARIIMDPDRHFREPFGGKAIQPVYMPLNRVGPTGQAQFVHQGLHNIRGQALDLAGPVSKGFQKGTLVFFDQGHLFGFKKGLQPGPLEPATNNQLTASFPIGVLRIGFA